MLVSSRTSWLYLLCFARLYTLCWPKDYYYKADLLREKILKYKCSHCSLWDSISKSYFGTILFQKVEIIIA